MGFIAWLADAVGMGQGIGKIKKELQEQVGALVASLEDSGPFEEQDESFPATRASLEDLKKSFRDEEVSNARDFLKYVVMQLIGIDNYTNPDEKKQELVRKAFENMDGSFYSHCSDLLDKGIHYGFSVAQDVYDVKDGDFLLGWMVNYDSSEISFKVAKNKRNKEFISKVKKGDKEMEAHNFVIYQYGDLSNVYGYGRGNHVQKWYRIKLLCVKMWPIFIQKFTLPTILAKAKEDVGAFFKKVKRWLFNNVFSVDLEKGQEIELIERKAGVDSSSIYEKCIEFCNKMIYKSFFMLSLLSGGESGGSYALGEKHFSLFLQAAQEIAKDFADNILISQIVAKLLDYNFGECGDYGKFVPSKSLSIEQKKQWAETLYRLVTMGTIDGVRDAYWIRKDFELPEQTEEELGQITDQLQKPAPDKNSIGNKEKTEEQADEDDVNEDINKE